MRLYQCNERECFSHNICYGVFKSFQIWSHIDAQSAVFFFRNNRELVFLIISKQVKVSCQEGLWSILECTIKECKKIWAVLNTLSFWDQTEERINSLLYSGAVWLLFCSSRYSWRRSSLMLCNIFPMQW